MKNTLMMVLFIAATLVSGCVTSHSNAKAWDYKVVDRELAVNNGGYYALALKQAATDGWQVVSSQIIPKSSDEIDQQSVRLYIVLRHAKE